MAPPKDPPDRDSIVWSDDGDAEENGAQVNFVDESPDPPAGENRNIITLRETSAGVAQSDGAATPADGLAKNVGLITRGQMARARDGLAVLARAFPDDVEVTVALAAAAAACGDDVTFVAKRKRFRADWVAGHRPPGILSFLVRALSTDHPSLTHAASALGVDVGDVAIGPLLNIVERETGVPGAAVARALAALGVERARSRLLTTASDASAWGRFDALEALGKLGDSRGIALLLEQTVSPHAPLRAKAACALGGAGDRDVADSLLGLTLDTDESVRRSAALALGELGANQFVFPLRRLLSDPSEWVRVAAAGALAALDDTDGIPTLLASLRPDAPTDVRLAGGFLARVHRNRPSVASHFVSHRVLADAPSPDVIARIDADFSLARIRWRRWFAPKES
ncbi:MAG: HEAT repeat domain-containing protein [Deltaproteobacteria bacterium]|nr:HEAT repeat domain-containing protein [Deltaproteobacteria bacterium]